MGRSWGELERRAATLFLGKVCENEEDKLDRKCR